LRMAIHAALSVVGNSPLRRHGFMGIVARRASEFAVAGAHLEAEALVHLFDMADRLVLLARSLPTNEHGPEFLNRHPGPEIVEGAAAPRDPRRAFEMALLAHRLAKFGGQPLRIDDVVPRRGLGVPFAGAVAAFAAYGVAAKHRLVVPVARPLHRLYMVRVA